MKRFNTWMAILVCFCFALPPARAQETNKSNPFSSIKKISGPTTATLKDIAEIKVPAGFTFINGEDVKKLKQLEGEPVSGRELGLLSPTNGSWAVWFQFNEIGYVKDDEKDKLDPDALLKTIKEGNDQANEYRKQKGAPAVKVIGWEIPPRYNAETHNLEWAIRGEVEGQPILNFNTQLLGRRGTMAVVLAVEPEQFQTTLPQYQTLLGDYSFKEGQRYAEYRKGDKLAQYGLAALITGGAAVVAVKTGLLAFLITKFKVLWKFIILGIAAIGGFLKKLITGDRSKKQS